MNAVGERIRKRGFGLATSEESVRFRPIRFLSALLIYKMSTRRVVMAPHFPNAAPSFGSPEASRLIAEFYHLTLRP